MERPPTVRRATRRRALLVDLGGGLAASQAIATRVDEEDRFHAAVEWRSRHAGVWMGVFIWWRPSRFASPAREAGRIDPASEWRTLGRSGHVAALVACACASC